MSVTSGLTWVSVVDNSETDAPGASWCQVFSNYDEARAYGEWLSRWSVGIWGNNKIQIGVYSSFGQNGYYNVADSSFVPFD